MRPPRAALRALLLLLSLLAVMSLRQPDKLRHPQFWAEDGPVFYLEAEHHGAASLIRPYNGYWHLYPRSVALLGTRVPVLYLPALYTAGAVLAALLALVALVSARLSSLAIGRAAMVAAVLLVPFSGELWLTLTNTQWFGALLLIVLLAAPAPPTRLAAWCCTVGGVVMALTGPFALLLWPCAALRAWWHRDRWSLWLLAVFTACAAATAMALVTHPRGGELISLPHRLDLLLAAARHRPLALLGATSGTLFLALGLTYGGRHRLWALTACSMAGLLVIAATAATVPLEHLGTRYLFLPWAAGTWTAVMLAERGHRLAWCALAGALAVALANFPLPPLQPYPWARDAECLERQAVCDVVVNPAWRVGLPGRGGPPR